MIDGNRFYKIQGQRFPSVTTILKIISKPGLMVWLAKQQEQSIKDITEKALDIGSQAHAGIAALTQRFIGKEVEIPPIVDDALIAIRAWDEWVEHESIKFLESEVVVWCEECEYAGTLDFIATRLGHVAASWASQGCGEAGISQANLGAVPRTPAGTTTDSVKTGGNTDKLSFKVRTRKNALNAFDAFNTFNAVSSNEYSESIDKRTSFNALRVGNSEKETLLFFKSHSILIGDYKTSKGLYRDYELQVLAYAHAWLVRQGISHLEAMTPAHFVSLCLIRLPKNLEKNASNGIEVKYLDNPPAMSVFLAARDLWRWMNA